MRRIVVFGAGGRAGRRVVAEAASRGHQVTAVVRDPRRHQAHLAAGASIVAGDVTSSADVAELAAGHDAAVNAAVRLDIPAEQFFPAATAALIGGLARTEVRRLVAIGIGTVLEIAPGVAFHDTPGFPAEARAFSLGHAAQLEMLRGAAPELDWLVIAPPPVVLDDEAPRTGRYRIGGTRTLPPADSDPVVFSYADLAVALIDEVETPKHHRTLVAVTA